MDSSEPSRSTLALALASFAVLNAMTWVAGLRVADHVLDLGLSRWLLGVVAAVTALAVPVALGAAHALATETDLP